MSAIDAYFNPSSIAVVGASTRESSVGHAVLRNLLGKLIYGVLAARRKTVEQARKLLRVSVIYLPLLYVFLVADKV